MDKRTRKIGRAIVEMRTIKTGQKGRTISSDGERTGISREATLGKPDRNSVKWTGGQGNRTFKPGQTGRSSRTNGTTKVRTMST